MQYQLLLPDQKINATSTEIAERSYSDVLDKNKHARTMKQLERQLRMLHSGPAIGPNIKADKVAGYLRNQEVAASKLGLATGDMTESSVKHSF
jgi:hypothetical protein